MSSLYLEEYSFRKLGTLSDNIGNLIAVKPIPGPRLDCEDADGSHIY